MKTIKLASVLAFLAALLFPGMAFAQTDPGVRSSTGVNAGQPFCFRHRKSKRLGLFFKPDSRSSTSPNRYRRQLRSGTRFNLDGCGDVTRNRPRAEPARPPHLSQCRAEPQSQVIANGGVNGSANTTPYSSSPTASARSRRFPFFF